MVARGLARFIGAYGEAVHVGTAGEADTLLVDGPEWRGCSSTSRFPTALGSTFLLALAGYIR
jgi:hypothetical protein